MIKWIKEAVSHYKHFSEDRLIKAVQRGNTNAFGQLYSSYIDSIFRYIFYRVNRETSVAEDLTSLTFQKAYMNITKFQTDKGTFKAWLFRIAHNVVIDEYRQPAVVHGVDEAIPSHDLSLEEQVGTKLEIEKVHAAFSHLTDEQQNVIAMRFIEDMSHGEIADVIGKKEGAVRGIQYRALVTLRSVLT